MAGKSIEGVGTRLKGYVKEAVAELTGDAELQEEGRHDIAQDRRTADVSGDAGTAGRPEEGKR